MSKIRTLLFTVLLMVSQGALYAQDSRENMRPVSSAKNNWFISAGVGANLLVAEQDDFRPISERLRLGGELSGGKWFNPNFGMRLQLTGGGLRGFNHLDFRGGHYTRADRNRDFLPTGYYVGKLKLKGEGFWQDFHYGSMTMDLMMNLTNLFRGYYNNPNRVDVVPFVGIGYLHGVKSHTNPTFDGFVVKLGTRFNFNFNPRWSLYLEPQANLSTDQFDGYTGNRGYDVISNLFLGVQLNIDRKFRCCGESLSQDEINRLNDKINSQYQQLENQQGLLDHQQQQLNDLKNRKPETVPGNAQPETRVITNTKMIGSLPEYVRFVLDSSVVEETEKLKVENVASYLKANPGSKLLVIGYADRKTGNPDYNYGLSCRRVESVSAALNSLGIDSSRLIKKCMGDKEQPYEQNDWNRVVIMVER